MKHAVTMEQPVIKNRVWGTETTVFWSNDTKTVSQDFLKDGQNKAKKLLEMRKR
jgi:hypothetical protein